MLDFTAAGWVVMAALWLFVALYICKLIMQVWNQRMVRCPETGAITLVSIRPAARTDGNAPASEVRHCALWQDGKEECAQGCLARHPEVCPSYRVNAAALRPYER